MRIIKRVTVIIPAINQEFELGDLTIFIGRSNSGKTRILTEIYNKIISIKGIWTKKLDYGEKEHRAKLQNILIGDVGNIPENLNPYLISSPRINQNIINSYTLGLNRIKESAQRMDSSIDDFGNQGVQQQGIHRSLETQGSGIQNIMQIISKVNEVHNFLLIDEPEISQYPVGKIQVLSRMLELLDTKQILFATHDPTLINQYLIKKILKDKFPKNDFKIIVYSFCEDGFKKIDFNSELDPETHCGYLSQTFSGKPIHLIVEGQTEFYTFQALLHKYCLTKNITNFPKIINKISVSSIAGRQWKISIHHLPPSEHYTTILVLDGEYENEIKNYEFPNNFKLINSVDEIEDYRINILCLKAQNIEESFNGIFPNPNNVPKPLGLSELIWESDSIIEDLKNTSDNSKQIYEMIDKLVSMSKSR